MGVIIDFSIEKGGTYKGRLKFPSGCNTIQWIEADPGKTLRVEGEAMITGNERNLYIRLAVIKKVFRFDVPSVKGKTFSRQGCIVRVISAE